MVAYSCNPRTQEADTEAIPDARWAWHAVYVDTICINE